jgi:hypothetical protein
VFWSVVATVAGLAAVMLALVWLGRRVRRRGTGTASGFVGPFEEMWHPAAHRARREAQVVQERTVPAPSPGDRLRRGDRTASRA